MSNYWAISGPQVYAEQGMLRGVNVLVRDHLIDMITDKLPKVETVLHFPENYYLVPGFIDLHIHGANNQDVMDASADALKGISQAVVAEGTTAFLATTMTADSHHIEKVLSTVRDVMRVQQETIMGAAILGVHLEGPFISSEKVGAQNKKNIAPLSIECIEHWQALADGAIKLITLAPELANSSAFIAHLKKKQIVASMGHSNATYAEAMAGIEAGCSYATHIFNAMRGIHQREPGIVTAALLSNAVSTELILDGVHLHPAIVQLILKLKSKDKMIIVTDAMRAKCLCDGHYELGGQAVEVKNGIASLEDGTLAGSILRMPQALQNLLKFTDCSLADAIQMMTENPAKIAGVFSNKGSIARQKDADLVVLDEQYQVALTVCAGQIVYSR